MAPPSSYSSVYQPQPYLPAPPSQLNRDVSTCEKLLRYPTPLSYTRHTSRFLISWLGLLPLAVWVGRGRAGVPHQLAAPAATCSLGGSWPWVNGGFGPAGQATGR